MNYNQDFEAAKNWYKIVKEQNNQQAIDILEQFFPKLKDIYIIDTLVSICNRALPDIFKKYGCDKDDVLEWLNFQYDENMSLINNTIEYDNKHPKKKSLNVDDLSNIQSITKILNNAKKYYCNDDEIVRGIEWVNSLKSI